MITKLIIDTVQDIIINIETNLYESIYKIKQQSVCHLNNKKIEFLSTYVDCHEKYFTDYYNNRKKTDNDFISKISTHNPRCILNIVANLSISVHFNLNRKTLNVANIDTYRRSLRTEILIVIDTVDINKLFDHICDLNYSKALEPAEKFITITVDTKKID